MIKTTILLAALSALFMIVGYLIGGITGSIIALVLAIVMNGFTYWQSHKLVLALAGAKEATQKDYPLYYSTIEKLIKKANLPMPRLYIIDQPTPNAFATGRNPKHSGIAVSTGLLNILSPQELEGVLAHELSHIKHRDILISTIAATFAAAISSIASIFMFSQIFGGFRNDNNNNNVGGALAGLLLMILAPIAAGIIQMAVSRTREYKADELGGRLCGNPIWLANALIKLEAFNHPDFLATPTVKPQQDEQDYQPTTTDKVLAHMYIVHPLHAGEDNLFSTHPSTHNRINALVKQAAAMGISHSSLLTKAEVDKIINTGYTSANYKKDDIIETKSDISKEKPKDYDTPNNPWI